MPLSILVQWGIMGILMIYFYFVGRKFEKIPKKTQMFWEIVIDKGREFLRSNLGEQYIVFNSYFIILAIFILVSNLTGMVGIKNPTTDFSVCFSLGIINFILIQYYAVKRNGVKEYFKGFTKPMVVMLPMNVMERVLLPISLSLRLFGNMFAAYMILELVYKFLVKISVFAGIGLPIPLHLYFDLFDGTLQTIIFVLLSMINLKIISEH